MTIELKFILYSTLAGLPDHEEGIFLEDAIVPLLISLAKMALRHRFSDPDMIEFSYIGVHRNDEIH